MLRHQPRRRPRQARLRAALLRPRPSRKPHQGVEEPDTGSNFDQAPPQGIKLHNSPSRPVGHDAAHRPQEPIGWPRPHGSLSWVLSSTMPPRAGAESSASSPASKRGPRAPTSALSVFDWCRANRVDWLFGLAPNGALCRHVMVLEKSTAERFKLASTLGKLRRFT